MRPRWLMASIALVVTGMLASGCAKAPTPVIEGKVQPGIWDYQNVKQTREKALLAELDRKQWQALTAACLTPAFFGREQSTPLLFSDRTEKRALEIPHETLSIESLGGDAAAATAAIATRYWQKAELLFAVDNYEQALWAVPAASFLEAPILVAPTRATLSQLDARCAIVIGTAKPPVAEVVNLPTKEDVWRFQLDLYQTKAHTCDYIVMTNPHDTDDNLNPNVQWPYLSLASAPLAAYRKALVQTGDYTGDRERLHALGGAPGAAEDRAKYEFVKPTFTKVKDESYAVEKFLADHGGNPEYIAFVGGSIELPFYICDIQVLWTYWDCEQHYVPAETPYATMRTDVDFTRFVKPDLAPGRIMGDGILDVTWMLMRTFWYREFLPGGEYASLAPAEWERKAVLIDGHRLNQPEAGGPPASPDEPFHPAQEIVDTISGAGYETDYLVPRDVGRPADKNQPIEKLLGAIGDRLAVQFVAHGDPPFMRIEIGGGGAGQSYHATGPKIRQLMEFDAPAAVYVIGCNTAALYASLGSNEEYIPPSMVDAGAVTYIAPHTCQSVCFWRYAPQGPASIQTVYFWENALARNMPVGKALNEAKWRAYQEWKDKQYEPNRGRDTDNAVEPDGPTVLLFGDPALQIGKAG
ncbi:MAG: hypothetical protein JSV79_00690 [Armatimonadota bacterium]|nr:MAG: hypothetical protein JSV79_00690 [Armatimonadota bacterium]